MGRTPGKWQLGRNSDSVITDRIENTDDKHVAYYGGRVVAESISSDSDRHLISAAPELLEALQEVLKYCNDEVHSIDVWERAEHAIRKAGGERE
ncbi:hypothetical protein [Oceanobacillus profundus]|uniref:Uncharacterized protein n=1 Tax=Oceanobacillus profundus TaxID=372463 RepID=A0A417YJR5_9BACI|nr:hypothetical protein [Oceanobacillus profundus]RHW33545.1 hypothetical protein D1B32_05755 [Oceanobacillus profundus]